MQQQHLAHSDYKVRIQKSNHTLDVHIWECMLWWEAQWVSQLHFLIWYWMQWCILDILHMVIVSGFSTSCQCSIFVWHEPTPHPPLPLSLSHYFTINVMPIQLVKYIWNALCQWCKLVAQITMNFSNLELKIK